MSLVRSQLVVDVPADNLALLSIEEMRAAAGVTGSARDAELRTFGLGIASAIMSELGIAVGRGASEPTLWQETLTETFFWVLADELLLTRRHEVEVISVVSSTGTLDPAEYDVDPEAGILTRLCGDRPIEWRSPRFAVTYKAGFAEAIPGDLKRAATEFFRLAWQSLARDPALKSEVVDVPDVLRTEKNWWVGSVPGQSGEGAVPASIAGKLQRYRNVAIG
ncbi:MAG: hypothetical protein ABS35_15365 [Kaistia sp. SCN 65-12]|nr:MAG: hypothetical protein ABS35_15365 [Kaistia sp. SCN 65-12]